MIVDLPEMVPEMRQQMEEKIPGSHGLLENGSRIGFVKFRGGEVVERLLNYVQGIGDLNEQFLAGHVFPAEFKVAVPHVVRTAQFFSDESIQIAYQVEAEIARSVGNGAAGLPDGRLILICLELAGEFAKVSDEEVLENPRFHKT